MYRHGKWTPVFGDFWNLFDAMAVCRELGYSYAVDAFQSKLALNGNELLQLPEFSCGEGNTLSSCSGFLGNTKKASKYSAGVECSLRGKQMYKLTKLLPSNYLLSVQLSDQ